MTAEQRLKVQAIASDVISQVLEEFDADKLASHETSAADMVANSLVEWNRGKCDREARNCVAAAANDILEAVRRRRKELHDGTTSLG
jgi:hypothetical protein